MFGERSPHIGGSIPKHGDGFPNIGGSVPKHGERFPKIGGSVPNYGERFLNIGGSVPEHEERFPHVGEHPPKIGRLVGVGPGYERDMLGLGLKRTRERLAESEPRSIEGNHIK
jgi:hypothetical protein